MTHRDLLTMLVAEDDADDRLLTREALAESQFAEHLRFVFDGEELMDYLHRRGNYVHLNLKQPGLILLDLNMPRKDGREALREIKSDPHLRQIPVVVLTTSRSDADIHHSYALGANSFIVKPVTFGQLVEVMGVLNKYWFDVVELLPPEVNYAPP